VLRLERGQDEPGDVLRRAGPLTVPMIGLRVEDSPGRLEAQGSAAGLRSAASKAIPVLIDSSTRLQDSKTACPTARTPGRDPGEEGFEAMSGFRDRLHGRRRAPSLKAVREAEGLFRGLRRRRALRPLAHRQAGADA